MSFSLFNEGLGNGELNQGFLLQQLSNPNVSQRDREIIIATLGNFNPTIPFPDANASNPPNNIVPMPNNVMNNQLPVPNAAIPPIPAPNNAPLSNDMIRHLYLQAVAGQKQQLRISPLPNGMLIIVCIDKIQSFTIKNILIDK